MCTSIVEIVGAETVREPDGLAMSSRNAYLTEEERTLAKQFPWVLSALAIEISKRPDDFKRRVENARKLLLDSGMDKVDYLDVRDAAQSLEKAVTADYDGAHPLFINDAVNTISYDSRTLARLFFPEVSQFKGDFSGAASLISIDKARRLIGFEPEYSLAAMDSSDGAQHD